MKKALLVIDPQNIYTDPEGDLACENADATIDRINELISHFSDNMLPVIYCRHVHKDDGSDLGRMFDYLGDEVEDFNFKESSTEVDFDPRLVVATNSDQFTKNRYSAFINTPLQSILQRHGAEGVVIVGFMTNFCCESTAREAHDRDYFVDFITDATGTPGTEEFDQDEIRNIVSNLLEEGFSRVLSTEEFLEDQ